MKRIKLQERFEFIVRIKEIDVPKIERMMLGNTITWHSEFSEFVAFRYLIFTVNIRQAEIVRQLLKNITVYD